MNEVPNKLILDQLGKCGCQELNLVPLFAHITDFLFGQKHMCSFICPFQANLLSF